MCQEKASYLSTPPFKIAPDYPKKGQSNEEQLVLDDSWWQVFEVEHIYALLRCSSGVNVTSSILVAYIDKYMWNRGVRRLSSRMAPQGRHWTM